MKQTASFILATISTHTLGRFPAHPLGFAGFMARLHRSGVMYTARLQRNSELCNSMGCHRNETVEGQDAYASISYSRLPKVSTAPDVRTARKRAVWEQRAED